MTEEIKINGNSIQIGNKVCYCVDKDLIDYITNLQQDLEKANDIIKKDRQFYKCRMDEHADYKSRCEETIEYIENNKKETSSHFNGKEYVYRNFTLCCEPNDLLNILNGSDENE